MFKSYTSVSRCHRPVRLAKGSLDFLAASPSFLAGDGDGGGSGDSGTAGSAAARGVMEFSGPGVRAAPTMPYGSYTGGAGNGDGMSSRLGGLVPEVRGCGSNRSGTDSGGGGAPSDGLKMGGGGGGALLNSPKASNSASPPPVL